MVTADGIIVTFEHGDEETEGMQGFEMEVHRSIHGRNLAGTYPRNCLDTGWKRAPNPFGTVNRDLNFGGSIISLNNSFLYYHTRGPQTPLSNANIIKENINPGQSDHLRLGTTEIHLTNINLTSVTRKAHLSEFDRVHSLVQFTRQLVVQLASELHPQWTSVGDESDDGSVYSDDMDDMPMSSPSTRNPIDSLCTIQFGDALAEALSLLFFALLKEIGQEGASPNTSHFLVAQDSLNITILNKLPILPNFIPDTTSKEYAMKVTGVGRRNWKSGTAFFRILPMLSSLVLSSSTPLPTLPSSLPCSLGDIECSSTIPLSSSSWLTIRQRWGRGPEQPDHVAGQLPLLGRPRHRPRPDGSAEIACLDRLARPGSRRDVCQTEPARPSCRLQLHAAAEGRGEEAAEPQHTRLHAAPVCGRGGAGVGAIPMGQGGGCGAVHVCVGAVGECPVTLHQLYLRQIRLDEPVSPSAHQIAGDQQDESSWSVFAALFPHRHVPIVLPQQRCPPPTSPRPHCPRRVFAVSELLGDEPGTTDATQPLLVAPVLRQQAQDTHLQEERAVFEAKHKVTCLDVVISWRVMTGMSILAPLGDQVDFTQLFTINQCPRASSQNASCCSFSLPPPLLFDVSLRFRPHPYSRRDAAVRRRAPIPSTSVQQKRCFCSTSSSKGGGTAMWTRGRSFVTTSPSPRSYISPQPPARPSKTATLPFASSTASLSPLHPHHRSTSSREEHASPDNHPRPHNHQSVREVAALVEKALDKRALNLSRDNRNEMQMAARQNTSPSRSILTCSHHPSRLQFSSVPAFYLRHPMHLLLGGKGTVQIDHLLHIRTDTLRLFTSVFLRCSMSSSRLASTSNPTSSSSK
ncbi:hypothetical protein BLNAU_23572 [Blattamonas nauphoetae]|uniref:Uncharacterized protein n=1 Tax=Blattamonas nauphoetae TaxID=2049346 RepID=A0ABQ9WPW3_9EUKA|nr:hypothetical protein BLNAU_23572 [Blattamonas nauphoetae]